MSAEEQIYLVWPLLILTAAMLGARLRRRHSTLVMLAGITAASFAASVIWTAQDPSVAYFATPTRAWEFGAGALLTFLPAAWLRRVPSWSRIAAVRTGLALVAAAGLTFGGVAGFPGWVALVPVLGTAMVMAATHPRGALSLQPIAELTPAQKTGEWSCVICLWHWPLLILVPLAVGDVARGTPGKLALVAATVVLSWLTRELVKKPCSAPAVVRLCDRGGCRWAG